MSNWRSLSVNKMIVKLARKLFLLSGATLISLFLPLVSVSAKTDTIKVGYTHGLELFQENETLNALSEIKEQKVDFLIGPSNFFVEFRGSIPFTHLATRIRANGKEPAKTVGSTIIARSDRKDLNTVSDLQGKSIAASMPSSLGGWLAALREIYKQGVDPDSFFSSVHFKEFQTPDVVSSVLNSNVDAGILTTCVLEQIETSGMIEKGSLKVINQQPIDEAGLTCC